MSPNEKDDSILKQFGLFGITLGIIVSYGGAGFALGYFLWNKYKAPWPVFLITCGLGLFGAFRQILLAAKDKEK